MKTFLLPAATIVFYLLFSCRGGGRKSKEIPAGNWIIDSIRLNQDNSFKSAFFDLFILNDPAKPDLEFRKNSIFVFLGEVTDTLQYSYNQDRKEFTVNGQEDQTYHVRIHNEKNMTLVTNDSNIFFLKKL